MENLNAVASKQGNHVISGTQADGGGDTLKSCNALLWAGFGRSELGCIDGPTS